MGHLEDEIAEKVRAIGTSPQRFRNLFRRHVVTGAPAGAKAVLPPPPVTAPVAAPAPAPASVTAQATPDVVGPLPSFLLKPKVSKPMPTTINQPQATHKAKSFADRLRAVHTALDTTMEQGVTALEQIEQQTEAANAKIASVVSAKQADLTAINDVLNQLTNGGPELTDETAEPEQPATPPATA